MKSPERLKMDRLARTKGPKTPCPLYRQWLRAAWVYYMGSGENTGMTDAEWDEASRQLAADRVALGEAGHEVLFMPDFSPGQSLFWLKRHQYPAWAKGEIE